jgi:hypothetical protein
MPDIREMLSSVRFFESVAALALILVNDISTPPDLRDFRRDTRRLACHQTTAAERAFGSRPGTAEHANWTHEHAASTVPTLLGWLVERCADTTIWTSTHKVDGPCHHLLLAHPHTQAAEDAVFVLWPESLPGDTMCGRQILDGLGARRRADHELEQ